MKKFRNVLLIGAATAVLGLGVAVGARQSKVLDVKAATETTVYYAVPSSVVGTYTVKLNVNRQGDADNYAQYTMTKLSESYGGYDLYSSTYIDLYDGVGVMQFQLYDGENWVSQQQPIGSWTSVDQFNGKVYVHNDGWHEYTQGLDTYIPMRESFFTNWTNDAGSIRTIGANCWNGKSINALGPVMDGCLDHEGWTGTLNSIKWHQTTQWIYFEYGCANNNHVGEASDVKLVFNLWASADAVSPTYTHDFHNDTFSQTTLILRNFEIPEAEYNALNGDFYMSVDLVDGRTGDYGANEFGYLHVNQTHAQVSDAQWYYYTHCVEGEAASVLTLRNHYRLNGSLRNGFVYSDGFAESFDTQASFDANWVKDIYGNDVGERHQDRAISNSTYRNGGWNLPFNSTNGFFKGWYGEGNDDYEGHVYGYVASDDSVYRFISRPFRLPQNGIVSIKMAGNSASLHLIDFEGDGDLAWVDCKTFHSNGQDNLVATGDINVCTMVNHVVNFSKYGGRLVQIGIADVNNKEGGWNAVYFDELKANYATLPAFGVDAVEQDNGTKSYAALPDVYVNAVEGQGGVDYAFDDGPEADTCALKGAYDFVTSYYSTFRNKDNYFSFCQADDASSLFAAYSALSAEEQALVDATQDFDHGRDHTGDWWTKQVRFTDEQLGTMTVGKSVQYLATMYHVSITVKNTPFFKLPVNLMNLTSGTLTAAILPVAIALALGAVIILMIKKRKKQK